MTKYVPASPGTPRPTPAQTADALARLAAIGRDPASAEVERPG